MHESDLRRLLRAHSFAARQHAGQMRQDGRTPYAAHPARVMTILAVVFGVRDVDLLAAAVLHDVIEDTTADRDDLAEQFGERVAELVAALSKDKRLPEAERERRYLESLVAAPLEVQLCKLGDVYDNLLDSATLSEAGRNRQLERARRLVDGFTRDFPSEWSHVLELVRRQIAATGQGPAD